MKSAFGTRTPEVNAVPGEDQVLGRIDLGGVGQLAVGRVEHLHVGQLQLLGHVGDPVLAEGLEGQQLHGLGPSIDHIAISTAPVSRAGDDADQEVGGDFQDFARLVDGGLQAALAQLERCDRPKYSISEIFGVQSGALGEAGRKRTRGEPGGSPAWRGSSYRCLPSLQMDCIPLGDVARRRETRFRRRKEIFAAAADKSSVRIPGIFSACIRRAGDAIYVSQDASGWICVQTVHYAMGVVASCR